MCSDLWPGSIPQRSRSHKTFKGQSIHACFRAVTYVCIDGITLLKILKACYFIDVTNQGLICLLFFSQNNLDIVLTYSTHNLNNFNKYPSITCSYIQEYLGYLSNNLFFLSSHSWPVVVYNFGQFQHTSQVERKPRCS